jgi:hypothetical protein
MNNDTYHSRAPDNVQRLRPDNVPRFATTLDPSLPPTVYRISHDSELLLAGERSHWYFVKDKTNTATLYAIQSIWNNEEATKEAVLWRAGEFLPAAGAIHVSILKTPRGAYMLKMTGHRPGLTLEMPDRVEKSGGSHAVFIKVDVDLCGRNQSTQKCSTSSNGMNCTKLHESGPREAVRLERWTTRLWAIASAGVRIMEVYVRTIPYTWLVAWISTSGNIYWRVNLQEWFASCIRQPAHPEA